MEYFDPKQPGSFTSAVNLRRYAGKTEKDAQSFLSSQDAYTLHRPTRINFRRRKTYAKCINDLFQADLVDLSNQSRYNDGFRYLLTCIDVFSKYAFEDEKRTGSDVSI
jgi:hypothetical protein